MSRKLTMLVFFAVGALLVSCIVSALAEENAVRSRERQVQELREKGRFVKVSLAGLSEAHPHDVKIMKEAPNYRQR